MNNALAHRWTSRRGASTALILIIAVVFVVVAGFLTVKLLTDNSNKETQDSEKAGEQATPAAPTDDVVSQRSGNDAGLPPLKLVRTGMMQVEPRIDHDAFVGYAESLELPAPPAPGAVDFRTYDLLHEAFAAMANGRTVQNLTTLGGLFQANASPAAARACYEAANDIDDRNAERWHLLGRCLMELAQFDDAQAAFNRAIELKVGEVAVHALLGDVLLELNLPGPADASFQTYLDARPLDSYGDWGKARVANADGRLPEAVTYLERALERTPQHQPALYLLATVARRLNMTDKADDAQARGDALPDDTEPTLFDSVFTRMHKNAKSTNYFKTLMVEYERQGQIHEAYTCAKELMPRVPNDVVTFKYAASLADRLGRHNEAGAAAQVVVKLDPTYAEGHLLLANALMAAKRFEEAIVAADEAARLKPEHGIAFIAAGLARLNAGHIVDAVDHLAHGLTLEPRHIQGRRALAACLLHLEKTDAARDQLEVILELDPGHAWAREQLDALGKG